MNQEQDQRNILKQRYEEILPYCTILFGSIRDLTELLEWRTSDSTKNPIAYIQSFLAYYDIEWFAGTKRTSHEGRKQ